MTFFCVHHLIYKLHISESFKCLSDVEIINKWGRADLDSNRLSTFKMRNPLGMKGIYDFISFPSVYPDTYLEIFCLTSYCHC